MKLLIYILLSVIITEIYGGGLYVCKNDKDCPPAKAKCVHEICECPGGEIFSKDGSKCLILSKKVNGECEIDEQCAIIGGNVACRDGTCQCNPGHIYFRSQCILQEVNNVPCSSNEECFNGMDYFARECREGICQCAAGYYDRDKVDCRRKAALGQICALNIDCQDPNTICENKMCIEAPAFVNSTFRATNFLEFDESNDEIIVDAHLASPMEDGIVLNAACEKGDTCADAHALCSPITRTCSCRPGYTEIRAKGNTRLCFAELGMSCSANSDCVPNAECTNSICSCPIGKHFDATNTKCRKSAYQVDEAKLTCNNRDSCRALVTNYYCDGNDLVKFCRCDPGYRLSENFICELSCKINSDCLIEHQVCDDFSNCVCDKEYKLEGNTCKPRIGGVCKADEDCQAVVGNSHCDRKSKVCVCNEKYVENNYECYPVIEVGRKCQFAEQCQWKSDASCAVGILGEKYCNCHPGFKNVGGNCLRVAKQIGDYCTHPSVCMTDTMCSKSKCTCKSGMKPSMDRRICLAIRTGSTGVVHLPLAGIYVIPLLFKVVFY